MIFRVRARIVLCKKGGGVGKGSLRVIKQGMWYMWFVDHTVNLIKVKSAEKWSSRKFIRSLKQAEWIGQHTANV